jgi:hypothetical protein
MELTDLQRQFPKTKQGALLTGVIPMSFVDAHLAEIKEIVRKEQLRRFYRGPRPFYKASDTHKDDAHGMVLARR